MRGTASDLAARFGEPVRGEVTIVVGQASARPVALDDALAAVGELVAAGAPRRAAVDVVARLLRIPRNELYEASLARPD